MYTITVLVILVVMFLAAAIRILNEYQRAVIFRLGRVIDQKGPGLIENEYSNARSLMLSLK